MLASGHSSLLPAPAATLQLLPLFILVFCFVRSNAQPPGYSVQHFNSETGLQNTIKGIEIDKRGYLWLATESGLARYDGSQFKLYNSTNTPVIKTDRIKRIGLAKDSSIFTEDAEGNLYNFREGVLNNISPGILASQVAQGLAVVQPYAIYARCKIKFSQNKIPEWALPDFRLITRSAQNSIVYKNGCYYYFNKDRAFIRIDTSLNNFQQLGFSAPFNRTFMNRGADTVAVSLLQCSDSIYLRWDKSIYQLAVGNHNKTVTAIPVLNAGDISNITCYLNLPAYNLQFVGTMSNGLYVYKKQQFSVLKLADKEANIFYAQQPYGNDGVLTKKGVLFNNKYIPLPPGFISETILKTREGSFFLARVEDMHGPAAVIKLNSHLKTILSIPIDSLPVRCFQQFNDGTVWLSCDQHFLGSIHGDKLEWLQRPAAIPADFHINTFIETGNNILLAGGNKGLAEIDLSANKGMLIPALNNVTVRSLYKDENGAIFIGSYGKGYYVLYKGKLVAMPQDANNYLASAHCFLTDDKGYMWISANRGLFRLLLKDAYNYIEHRVSSIYYDYYDNSDGFLTNEFNGGCVPSAIKLNNGAFSLPSLNGLVQFYPDSIQPVLPSSGIYIDAIMVDDSVINQTGKLKITRDVNHLQFFVSSPYFGNTNNQVIEYKLEGFDNEWLPLPVGNIINYNKLPAGDFRLVLRKKSGFGNSFIQTEIAFIVLPSFYQTPVFFIALLLAIAGFMYLFFHFRLKYLIIQKNKLKEEVFKRTGEQNLLINDLETTVKELELSKDELHNEIAFKEKLAMIISHDIQYPLRFLFDVAQRLHKKSLQINIEEISFLSAELQKASGNMYSFVEDFSTWLKSMQGISKVQATWFCLQELLVEVNDFLANLFLQRQNKLVVDDNDNFFIYTDRQLFKIVMRNLMDNANKYTSEGTITIKTITANNKVSISIADTGNGISAANLENLNRKIQQPGIKLTTEGHSGFGYIFIIDFCRLLNIGLTLNSKTGDGTIVCLDNIAYKRNSTIAV